MSELLPCPFCRGTDLSSRADISEDKPHRVYAHHVFCHDCHAHGRNHYPIGWCESHKAACEAWNDRAEQWQPIETAPRDGTWFVICNAGDVRDGYEVGCYDPYMTTDYVETEPGSEVYRQVKRSSYDWTGFNNFHRATHWMPLPAPPKVSETDDLRGGK